MATRKGRTKIEDGSQVNIFDIIIPKEENLSMEEIDFRTLWKYKGMDAAVEHYIAGARARISQAIDEAERKTEQTIAVRKKQAFFSKMRENYGLNPKKYAKTE